MSFHLDTLHDALVAAGLAAIEAARPTVRQVGLTLADDDEALLPQWISTGGAVDLPLAVEEPNPPDLAPLARLCKLSVDALSLDGGVAGDLLLVMLIDAAEAIAAGAHALGLSPGLVPAGYLEPGEGDLLDADAREVIWEDLREGLRALNPAARTALAEFFYGSASPRAAFLAALT